MSKKRTGEYLNCNQCENKIYVQRSLIKKWKTHFCSGECRGQYFRGIRLSPITEIKPGQHLSKKTEFKKGKRASIKTEFKKGQVSLNKGKRASGELRKKLSESHKGIQAKEKHPNWRGGLSEQRYPSEFNKLLKEKILRRDKGDCCQLCGVIPEICGKLVFHHIDYNKYNNREDNLISLCNKCNIKVNQNRIYWTNYFKDRIARNYFYFSYT